MVNNNLKFIPVETLADAKKIISDIGCDPKSIDIMVPKAVLKVIKLENVVMQDAIIMKQDMLSIGGEVALPKDAFNFIDKPSDILIIGTIKHHTDFVKKLNRHYPRIQKIAKQLSSLLENIS